MSPRPLIDTGVLIALLDARDIHHAWSRQIASKHSTGFATCEAVLSELFYQVRASERAKHAILAMIESDWLHVLPVLPALRVAVARVLEKYHPAADYADACLVALHEHSAAPIATVDRRDFSLYRTRSGRTIPVILPA